MGAVGKDSVHASYSSTGAALFIAAPGGDVESYTGMVVPLPGGGCHDIGMGSSFATPLTAGVIALVLQANPYLSWRDVQGVLATTSTQVDMSDTSWTTNAAGFHHSYKYGFGVINAGEAVAAAQSWINYSTEVILIGDSGYDNQVIPEYLSGDVVSTITMNANATFVAESTTIYVNLTDSSRGDLELVLISPSGTESIVHPGRRPENQQGDDRWKLMTVRNWGEPVIGDWRLRITDKSAGDVSECVDQAWSTEFGGQFIDCQFFLMSKACVDGAQGPDFLSYFSGVSDLNAVALTDINGVGPSSACCVCGGGTKAALVDDVLRSWRLEISGHEDIMIIPHSSPPTPGTVSLGLEASAMPTAGFGSATIALPPPSTASPSIAAPSSGAPAPRPAPSFGGIMPTETSPPATLPPTQSDSNALPFGAASLAGPGDAKPSTSAPAGSKATANSSSTSSPAMLSSDPPPQSQASNVPARGTLSIPRVLAAAFAVFAGFL